MGCHPAAIIAVAKAFTVKRTVIIPNHNYELELNIPGYMSCLQFDFVKENMVSVIQTVKYIKEAELEGSRSIDAGSEWSSPYPLRLPTPRVIRVPPN